MQTVLSSGNKAGDYAAGRGDLAGLTRAGAGILTPAPAQGGMNEFARHALIRALLGAGGAAGGSYYGGRQGALEGAVLGLGLPKIAGTLARAPFAQSYLANQLATGAAKIRLWRRYPRLPPLWRVSNSRQQTGRLSGS
jgi:hypothetical protein